METAARGATMGTKATVHSDLIGAVATPAFNNKHTLRKEIISSEKYVR